MQQKPPYEGNLYVHGSQAYNDNADMISQNYIWKTFNNCTLLKSASWTAVQPTIVLIVIAVWESCLICIDT